MAKSAEKPMFLRYASLPVGLFGAPIAATNIAYDYTGNESSHFLEGFSLVDDPVAGALCALILLAWGRFFYKLAQDGKRQGVSGWSALFSTLESKALRQKQNNQKIGHTELAVASGLLVTLSIYGIVVGALSAHGVNTLTPRMLTPDSTGGEMFMHFGVYGMLLLAASASIYWAQRGDFQQIATNVKAIFTGKSEQNNDGKKNSTHLSA